MLGWRAGAIWVGLLVAYGTACTIHERTLEYESTGGSGPAPASCNLTATDDLCQSCLKTYCCSEMSTCFQSTDCSALLTCKTTEVPDCEAQYPGGVVPYNAAIKCGVDRCSEFCSSTGA